MSRHIRYIGSNPKQKDNIVGSRTAWPHPGAVVEVPEEVAVRLIPHHTVFVEYKADNDPGDEVCYKVMTGTNECHYVNSKGEVVDAPKDVLDVQTVPPVDTDFAFSNDKDTAIRQAIEMIDTKDSDNLTMKGLPRIELIESILGYPCNVADRDRLWEEIQSEASVSVAGDNGQPGLGEALV